MLDNYFNVDEINFESSNVFSFEINKKFKIENLKIKSEIDLYNLQTKNNFDLENFFPNIEDEIKLKDQKIKIDYNNKKLLIIGRGSLITQKNPDEIEYRLEKNKDDYSFNINLDISKSEFTIKPLNFFKKENSETLININGNFFKNNLLFFDQVNIKNENNIINLKKIYFNENFELKEIQKADFDFIDIDNLRNNLSLNKKNKNYELKGKIFNVDKIIDSLIKDNDKGKSNLIRKKFKIYVNIDKVHLGSDYFVRDLKGFLEFDDSKIIGAELNSFFENDDEQLNFTIKKIDDKKVTTFFSGKAKPFVNKYDFVKGFEEGSLDFYSISSQNVSNSKLKIYDFKLKELPALTKLLTLASLQGIADLLSGEGIRFNEFEMNYENNNSLVKIDEIYAIGPAISILMEGYVERNKLISLRGTLVPATTINKAIGSIPILGDILVGKKTGEGVFGVSFKVKGTPKNLETSVNPIKTLTPRFITRTLEKIKKN
jgi:hypothetical protein